LYDPSYAFSLAWRKNNLEKLSDMLDIGRYIMEKTDLLITKKQEKATQDTQIYKIYMLL